METEINIQHTLKTSVCEMNLMPNNLIVLHIYDNASIEIPEVDDISNALNSLSGNKPFYLIVFPGNGSTSSEEARRHSAITKGKNIIAEAIVINNLATRLLANFYMAVNRPKQKMKLFSDSFSALNWINSIRDETNRPVSK